MQFIISMTLILFVSLILGQGFNRLKQPVVIGQILTGVLLGPAVLNWVGNGATVHEFAEIGVILLMFLAGLESDLKLLQKYWLPSLLVALLGVIVPLVGFFAVGLPLGFSTTENLVIAVIFAATSVSISVVVLKEMNGLTTREGATILGAAVIDDLLAVLLLGVVLSVAPGSSGAENPNLWGTLIWQAIFLVGAGLLIRWGAPFLMHLTTRMTVPMAATLAALVIALGMAWLADVVGLSAAVGSFFAGIAVGQSRVREEVTQKVSAVGEAIFIPIFFASIGLSLSFAHFTDLLPLILILSGVAILTKMVGAALGARLAGFGGASAWTVGAGMVSRGEMALIIAQLGFQAHLVSGGHYAAVIIAIVVATLLAPLLLRWTFQRLDA